jgi:putative membrane protein
MSKLILRWAVNALALYAAFGTGWIKGIEADNTSIASLFGLALVFGLVNALIRPLLKFMTCPLILLTLGLFTVLINAAMFWLTGYIGQTFDVGFTVSGFWPAIWGGLVVGIVSAILSIFIKEDKKSDRRRSER